MNSNEDSINARIVLGAPLNGPLSRYFGIKVLISDSKKDEADILHMSSRIDELACAASKELHSLLLDLKSISRLVTQGSLF